MSILRNGASRKKRFLSPWSLCRGSLDKKSTNKHACFCRALGRAALLHCAAAKSRDNAAIIWSTPVLSRFYGLEPQQFGLWMLGAMLLSGIIGSIFGGFAIAPTLVVYIAQLMGGEAHLAAALALTGVAVSLLSFFAFVQAMRKAMTEPQIAAE